MISLTLWENFKKRFKSSQMNENFWNFCHLWSGQPDSHVLLAFFFFNENKTHWFIHLYVSGGVARLECRGQKTGESALSFQYMGPEDWIQGIRLGSRARHPLCHRDRLSQFNWFPVYSKTSLWIAKGSNKLVLIALLNNYEPNIINQSTQHTSAACLLSLWYSPCPCFQASWVFLVSAIHSGTQLEAFWCVVIDVCPNIVK